MSDSMKELREAAEALIEFERIAFDHAKSTSHKNGLKLARHFLSQCDADGDEPVTEEWILSLGPNDEWDQDGDLEHPQYGWFDDSGEPRLVLQRYDQRVWVADIGDGQHWPDDIHARCQVRDIMKALGIKTTQQPRPREGT